MKPELEPVVWPSMNGTNYTAFLVLEHSSDPGQRDLVKIELYDPANRDTRFQFWVPREQIIRGDRAVAYHVARKMGLPVERERA